jgi:pterin-4a-carbinolamine dehydratase
MITIEVMGGLGNQLFQIFTLIAYGLINKVPFYFENKPTTRVDRPFYWDNFFSTLKPFVKSLYDSSLPIYSEHGFHYNQLTPYTQLGKPFKLFGYFQSYKYFQEKEQDIFRFIKLNKQKENIKNKYIQIYNFDDTISLHFRIGDYKNLQQHHPVMSVSYYISALKHITSRTDRNNWNVLYFYEEQDTVMVKQNIDELQREFQNITFTPVDTSIVEYEQVLLMSLCQHNIIANSSFSWWGAYFNQNMSKIVTYPSKWFGPAQGNKKMDDMYPIGWEKINI